MKAQREFRWATLGQLAAYARVERACHPTQLQMATAALPMHHARGIHFVPAWHVEENPPAADIRMSAAGTHCSQ